MALALVHCSIEANWGGTPHARIRVSLVSWEGGSHSLLFMVPLSLPSVRPTAQALQLPFEFLLLLSFIADARRLAFVQTICRECRHCLTLSDVTRFMILSCLRVGLTELPLQIDFSGELERTQEVYIASILNILEGSISRVLFDGSTPLTPIVHLSVDLSSLPQMSSVLSYCYLVCVYLPIRMAFTSLACTLSGPLEEISQEIKVQVFAENHVYDAIIV